MRKATITLTVDAPGYTGARIVGAGPGPGDSMDLYIDHDGGHSWVNTDMIAEIVFDPCGSCGRAIVEDGHPMGGQAWHLECAEAANPHA